MAPSKWIAPWTDEQVLALFDWQTSGIIHPYTCGADDCNKPLLPTKNGWRCPDRDCGYQQNWAHSVGDFIE